MSGDVLVSWKTIVLSVGLGALLVLAAIAAVWELKFAVVIALPLLIAGATFVIAAAFAALDRLHERRANRSVAP